MSPSSSTAAAGGRLGIASSTGRGATTSILGVLMNTRVFVRSTYSLNRCPASSPRRRKVAWSSMRGEDVHALGPQHVEVAEERRRGRLDGVRPAPADGRPDGRGKGEQRRNDDPRRADAQGDVTPPRPSAAGRRRGSGRACRRSRPCGSGGAGGRRSQPVEARWSRTNCLSKLGCSRPRPVVACGPEPARVRRERLVGQHGRPARVAAPLELRVGDDDAAREGVLVGRPVQPERAVAGAVAPGRRRPRRPSARTSRSRRGRSWALVAGVKIGSASRSPRRSPAGSPTPQTRPVASYSAHPLPAR